MTDSDIHEEKVEREECWSLRCDREPSVRISSDHFSTAICERHAETFNSDRWNIHDERFN